LLEKHRYACFSDPSHSQDERPEDEEAIEDLDLDDIWYVKPKNGALTAKPLKVCSLVTRLSIDHPPGEYLHIFQDHPYTSDPYKKDLILSVVQGLGPNLAKEVYFLV